MKVRKRVQGVWVELEFKKVKEYDRFTLYEVCKDGIPIYKESLTKLQLSELKRNNYIIEEVEDVRS
jgi:hypothetical protein